MYPYILVTIYIHTPHYTTLYFTAFLIVSLTPSLALFITFPTLFLKWLGLQEIIPKKSAGTWFQS
jgi:hypothetical protein